MRSFCSQTNVLNFSVRTCAPTLQIIIDVELTTLQKQYYRAIFDRNRAFLYKNNNSSGGGGSGAAAAGGANKIKGPQLMNIQMELRKCCNHPFLVEGVEQVMIMHNNGRKWGGYMT
jgi:chromodomain-helicase-DNA-binding protein 7